MAATRRLAQGVVVGRTIALVLYLVAWASVTATVDLGFSAFSFLRVILPLQLIVSLLRLLHDFTMTFYRLGAPTPVVILILYITDVAFHYLMFAAALSSITVVDLVARSLDVCRKFPTHSYAWYTSAGVLAMFGWMISVPVTVYTSAPAEFTAEEA